MLVALPVLYYFYISVYFLMSCSRSRDIACYVCVYHHTRDDGYTHVLTYIESVSTLCISGYSNESHSFENGRSSTPIVNQLI